MANSHCRAALVVLLVLGLGADALAQAPQHDTRRVLTRRATLNYSWGWTDGPTIKSGEGSAGPFFAGAEIAAGFGHELALPVEITLRYAPEEILLLPGARLPLELETRVFDDPEAYELTSVSGFEGGVWIGMDLPAVGRVELPLAIDFALALKKHFVPPLPDARPNTVRVEDTIPYMPVVPDFKSGAGTQAGTQAGTTVAKEAGTTAAKKSAKEQAKEKAAKATKQKVKDWLAKKAKEKAEGAADTAAKKAVGAAVKQVFGLEVSLTDVPFIYIFAALKLGSEGLNLTIGSRDPGFMVSAGQSAPVRASFTRHPVELYRPQRATDKPGRIRLVVNPSYKGTLMRTWSFRLKGFGHTLAQIPEVWDAVGADGRITFGAQELDFDLEVPYPAQPLALTGVAARGVTHTSAEVVASTTPHRSFARVQLATNGTFPPDEIPLSERLAAKSYSVRHSLPLDNLQPATRYTARVVAYDIAGVKRVSAPFDFTTGGATVMTPSVMTTQTSATITFTTSEPTRYCAVRWGSASDGQPIHTTSEPDVGLVTSHTINLAQLSANTAFRYFIDCKGQGQAGGIPYTWGPYDFATSAPPPPAGINGTVSIYHHGSKTTRAAALPGPFLKVDLVRMNAQGGSSVVATTFTDAQGRYHVEHTGYEVWVRAGGTYMYWMPAPYNACFGPQSFWFNQVRVPASAAGASTVVDLLIEEKTSGPAGKPGMFWREEPVNDLCAQQQQHYAAQGQNSTATGQSISLGCERAAEYARNQRCWGWLPTHTYDLGQSVAIRGVHGTTVAGPSDNKGARYTWTLRCSNDANTWTDAASIPAHGGTNTPFSVTVNCTARYVQICASSGSFVDHSQIVIQR